MKPLLVLLPAVFLVLSTNFFEVCHAHDQKFSAVEEKTREAFNQSDADALKHIVRRDGEGNFIFAKDRTHRIDPTDKFRYYKGGWNLEDKHYLASLTFTGVPLVIIAAVWILVTFLHLLAAACRCCCCRKDRGKYSKPIFAVSITFLIILIIGAIGASVILFSQEDRLLKNAKEFLDFVTTQAKHIRDIIKNVIDNLNQAKQMVVGQFHLPKELIEKIDQIGILNEISDQVKNAEEILTGNEVKTMFNMVRYGLYTFTGVMLALPLMGFVFALCGMRFVIFLLAIFSLISVTGGLVSSGVILVVKNGVGDTCESVNEWISNPTEKAGLAKYIPCASNKTTEEALMVSKDVITQVVNGVNQLVAVSNDDKQGTGPKVPLLCLPYNKDGTERPCAPGEVQANKAEEEWRKYICQGSADNMKCTTPGRLTDTYFNQMKDASKITGALIEFGPAIVSVADCDTLKENCRSVVNKICPLLKSISSKIFMALLALSLAVMFSTLLWAVLSKQKRRQMKAKQNPWYN